MAKRRKVKTERPTLDASDVLAGRVDVSPEDLFDLIHQVNPTLRPMSAREQTRRYALKNRLQSLLIRRFGDEHLAVERGDSPGVVSLNHRSRLRDACHAVLDELEPDARAWVRRRLDLAESPPVEKREPRTEELGAAGDDEGGDHLQLGRRALSEYDYEAAEGHLKLAFAARRSTEAALALLDLWVDHLGTDAPALALERELPAAARDHPGVRTLLALAAARLGETERAAALVQGISPGAQSAPRTRAAEVYVALAAQAVRGRDRQAARRFLDLAGEHDPAHPEIPRLGAAVAELRADDLRGVEAELARRYRAADCFAVEDEARALADRWPASETARQILREASEKRRAAEIAHHLESADQAWTEERFDDAARRYQAALDAGSERPDLAARLEEARGRDRRRREQARLDAVAGRFAAYDADPKAALLGYLALPERLRESLRVRVEAIPSPGGGREGTTRLLTRLDELAPPPSGAKAHAAVAAVLALGAAESRLAGGDAQAALDELGPHRAALASLEAARRVRREARRRLAEACRQRAREKLAAALEAFAGKRTADARELLDAVDLGDLGAGGRARAERLAADLRHLETLAHLDLEYRRLLAAGDLTGALDQARRLAATATEAEHAERWNERREDLARRLRDAWRVEVVSDEVPLAEPQGFCPASDVAPAVALLDDAGEKMVLANAWHDALFLRLVDVARRTVTARVSLRPPEPLAPPVAACWDGAALWVSGADGGVLEIAPEGWQIRGWHSLAGLAAEGSEIRATLPLPASSHLWMLTESGGNRQMQVVDLAARLVSRRLAPGATWAVPLFGPGEPRVLFAGKRLAARLCAARGTPQSARPLLAEPVRTAAVDPGGEGLLLAVPSAAEEVRPLLASPPEEERSEHESLREEEEGVVLARAVAVGGGWRWTSGIELPETLSLGRHQVASSLALGLGFALVEHPEKERELIAVELADGRLRPVYREPVPYYTTLVCDRRSRHVAALVGGDAAVDVVPLGAEPPAIPVPDAPLAEEWAFPELEPPFTCWQAPVSTPVRDRFLNAVAKGSTLGAAKFRRGVQKAVAKMQDQITELVYGCRDLRRKGFPPEVRHELLQELARTHPENTGVAMLLAEEQAEAGRWPEALKILDTVEVAAGDETDFFLPHFHHLHGLALFHSGETERARAVFKGGLKHQDWGTCGLWPLIRLTEPLPEPSAPHAWAPHRPLVHQLAGVIRAADQALAEDDAAGAAALLERPVVWRVGETQSAARLAAAYLETAATTPGERFRKRVALSFFLHAVSRGQGERRDLALAALRWDRDRLAELASRARAWLEEDGAKRAA